MEYRVHLRRPHPKQSRFVNSRAKRKVARAGRRGGKTEGAVLIAVPRFLAGGRVLYGTPTQDQLDAFWTGVKRALAEPIAAGIYYKNETRHVISLAGNVTAEGEEIDETVARIRAKTAWNADTLRGDYASLLILDEWHLMDETAWTEVGAPMLLDNNGDAVFIYTPPSMRSRSVTKAADPLHAPRMFKHAKGDHSACKHDPLTEDQQIDLLARWETFHWASRDNPVITAQALSDVTADMTALAIRQEIEAEDIDEVPGALWKREHIIYGEPPHATSADGRDLGRDLVRVIVAVDPAGSAPGGDKIGIVICGKGSDGRGYVLDDRTIHGLPDVWARRAIAAYHEFRADKIVAESNFGGEMVRDVISTRDSSVPVELVTASRGKQLRAEPVSALYEQGKVSHVRRFDELEEQMLSWTPESGKSPNNLDAMVFAMTELMVTGGSPNVRWL